MSKELYERGTILEVLRYNRGMESPIAFFVLLKTLHRLNLPLSPQSLRENLEYLAGKGAVQVKRRNEMPGFTTASLGTEERPDHIVTVKLAPHGMDIVQGIISDPGIAV